MKFCKACYTSLRVSAFSFLLLCAFVLCWCFPAAAKPYPAENSGTIVFENVTVVDVKQGRLVKNRTVMVQGQSITAVVDAGKFKSPPSATVVKASGKYLIPGLWDMHVHVPAPLQSFLDLFLANGVTGVRDLNTDPQMMPWLNEIKAGTRRGPRIVQSGLYLDGLRQAQPPTRQTANTPEQGRELVRERKKQGADFIKVYSGLQPNVYRAVLDEARVQGLSVAGHCPELVSAFEASRLGQKSIEHLTGIALSTSANEAALRQELAKAFVAPEGWDITAAARLRTQALQSPDAKKQAALFWTFAKNRTWQTPTLVTLGSLSPRKAENAPDPRLKYMPPMMTQLWEKLYQFAETPQGKAEGHVEYYEFARQTVRAMHRAGVPLLAGTDATVLTPNVFIGFALADELELLVQCGLSPAEALRTATLNPALYFGEEKISGTVSPGKRADLVLLNADPLVNINNVRQIAGVVARGNYLSEANLQQMLADIEAEKN